MVLSGGVAGLTDGHTQGGGVQRDLGNLEFPGPIMWRKKHWKSLRMSYSRAPFFDHYRLPYQQIYSREWSRFMPFLLALLNQHILELDIKTPLVFSLDMNVNGHKSGLGLDICKSLGATTYLSRSYGQNYIDNKAFLDNCITVDYQDYKHPIYAQS